ncbi:MAG: stage II sporulation protein P [Clostridium sp.]
MKNKSVKIVLLGEFKKFIDNKLKRIYTGEIKQMIKKTKEVVFKRQENSKKVDSYERKYRKVSNSKVTYGWENKFLLYFNITTILLVIIIFSPKQTINAQTKIPEGNSRYEKIINFNMPYLDNNNDRQGVIENILEYIGINLENPLSIMAKEVSYFKGVVKESHRIEEPEHMDHDREINEEELNGITSFDLSEADIVKIENIDTELDDKIKASIEENIKDKDTPRILIYNTHTHEGYLPGKPQSTQDLSTTVISVTEELVENLTGKYGINVLYDKTVHDLSYNDAYYRSSETLESQLAKQNDFDLIIDLHRDSSTDRKAMVCNINGEDTARYMFVVDDIGPYYDEHKDILNKIIDISEEVFPGFIRSNKIYHYETGAIKRLNQDKGNNVVVLEVGSVINDISESKNSAKYLATIIAQYIADKNE